MRSDGATAFLWTMVVAVAALGGSSAMAGPMHARAVIGLGVSSQLAPHGGIAHAERHQGSKWRVAHEEFGNNYTYGNAGSGHAHHHSGKVAGNEPVGTEPTAEQRRKKPPVAGSRGTSQYVKQTWLPSAAGDSVEIGWTTDSFLQIDPSELSPGGRLVSRATIAATGGLNGSIELSARQDRSRKPKIETRLTGIFERVRFEVVTHPNGVVSLHPKQPLKWTVKANANTFDIALDASIDSAEAGR